MKATFSHGPFPDYQISFANLVRQQMNLQPPKPLIFTELLTRCMGEVEFAQKILRDFFASSAPILDEIRICICQDSVQDAARKVHRLKGTAATVAARPFLESLIELEQLLQTEDLPVMNELSDKLAASCQKFEEVQMYVETSLFK